MPDTECSQTDVAPPSAGATRAWGFFPLLMVALVVLYGLGVNGHWRFQRDSALYMGLARSLAETGQYRFNHAAHTLALPGFPLLLSLVYRTVGESFLAMNVLLSLFGLGCVAVAYLLYRRLPLSTAEVGACILLFGLSRTLYYYSTHVMTDVPFTSLVLVALYCGLRMLQEDGRASWAWCVGASAACCAATAVRPFGPAVAVALLAGLWLRRSWRAHWLANAGKSMIVVLPLLLVVWAWAAYCDAVPRESSANYYSAMLARRSTTRIASEGLGRLPAILDAVPDAFAGVGMGYMGATMLSILMVAGLVRTLMRGNVLLPVYAGVYMGGVLIGHPGRRYLLPVLAIMVYWLVVGAGLVAAWLVERPRRFLWPAAGFWCVMAVELFVSLPLAVAAAALVVSALIWAAVGWWIYGKHEAVVTRRRVAVLGRVLLGMILAANLLRVSKIVQEARSADFYRVSEGSRIAAYFEVMDRLKGLVQPDDVVLTYESRLVHYFTRARASRLPRRWGGDGIDDLARLLKRLNVRYLIVDAERSRKVDLVDDLLLARPDAFHKLGGSGPLALLEVTPERLGG